MPVLLNLCDLVTLKYQSRLGFQPPPLVLQSNEDFEKELSSINDPVVRAHVRRLGIAHDRAVHRYRSRSGENLPDCVCRALSQCDEPILQSLLAKYFDLEGGDEVRIV
jgi:hypothetical protein